MGSFVRHHPLRSASAAVILAGGPSLIPTHGIVHALFVGLVIAAAVVFVASFFFHMEGGAIVRGGEGRKTKAKVVQKNKGGGDNINQIAGDNSVQIGKAESVHLGPPERSLRGRDTSALRAAAQTLAGQSIVVVSSNNSDESMSFARELVSLLSDAGWRVGASSAMSSGPVSDIILRYPGSNQAAFPWVQPIGSALRELGFVVREEPGYRWEEIRVGAAR